MTRTLNSLQTLSYCVLLLFTVAAFSLAYQHLCGQWVVYRKAENLFLRQRFDQAIPLYRQALQQGLHRPEALRHLGDAYLATQDFTGALHVFQKIVDRHPNDTPAALKLAELLAWTKQYQGAIRLLKRILQRDPAYRPARLLLARVLSWDGRIEEAIVQYRKILGESE